MTSVNQPLPNPESAVTAFGAVAPYYDELMAGVPYRFWLEYVERVWGFHRLAPKTVLDLACGTGIISRLLVQRAYSVTGVDLSPGMLETARARAREEHLAIDFFQQDAADLALGDRRMDAVVSLFDSLNYILDPARLAAAFQRVFDHLNPGGSFLFDLNTEYALEEGMFNQSCTRRDAPLHYRWRSRYDPDVRLCTVHMRFSYDRGVGERETFTEVHRQRAYSKEEICQWLRDAGFETITVYDAYTLDPPKRRSDRLFYLAVKSA